MAEAARSGGQGNRGDRTRTGSTAILHNGLGRLRGGPGRRPGGKPRRRPGPSSRVGVARTDRGCRHAPAHSGATRRAGTARGDRPQAARHRRPGSAWRRASVRCERTGVGRGPVPRGDRPARPHPDATGARPGPPAVRRVAAPGEPPRRRPRAAAHSPTRCWAPWARRRSPNAPAASCWPPARRSAGAPPNAASTLTAQEAADRPARRGRPHEPRDRRPAVPQSARTVEWHLRKVFTKLGIGSRRELRRRLSASGGAPGVRLKGDQG